MSDQEITAFTQVLTIFQQVRSRKKVEFEFLYQALCYAKKLFGEDEIDLGEKFDGQFDCAKFDCNGCNEAFVDGEAPKRNKD